MYRCIFCGCRQGGLSDFVFKVELTTGKNFLFTITKTSMLYRETASFLITKKKCTRNDWFTWLFFYYYFKCRTSKPNIFTLVLREKNNYLVLVRVYIYIYICTSILMREIDG